MSTYSKNLLPTVVIVIYITQLKNTGPQYLHTKFCYTITTKITISITQSRKANKMAPQAPTTKATSSRQANITDTSMTDINSSTDIKWLREQMQQVVDN